MKKTVLYPLTVIEVDLEGGRFTRLDLQVSGVAGSYAQTLTLIDSNSGYIQGAVPAAIAPEGSRFRITIEALDVTQQLENGP